MKSGIVQIALCVSLLAACSPPTAALLPTPSPAPTTVAPRTPSYWAGIDGINGELMPGKNITVVGWAFESNGLSPVTKVELILDGRWTIATFLGDERSDVMNKYFNGRPDALKTGWYTQFNTNDLSVGKHTLGMLLFDAYGQPRWMDIIYPFELAASQSAVPPIQQQNSAAGSQATETKAPALSGGSGLTGVLESVEGTVRPGWQLILKGWAAGQEAKTPVSRVEFYIADYKIGQTVPNLARIEIANRLKNETLKPGYTFRANVPPDLEPGTHAIIPMLVSTNGMTATGNAVEINVLPSLQQNAPPPPPPSPQPKPTVVLVGPTKEPIKAPEAKPTEVPKESSKIEPTKVPDPKP